MTIKEENYVVILGWMRTKLKLNGNDLLVYSMLYSFSQDGVSEFRGSISYMADFIGSGEKTVRRILKNLEELGYIEKDELNTKTGKTNGYKCVPLEKIDLEKGRVVKMTTPSKSGRVVKMTTPPGQNDHPHIYNNIYKKERKKEVYNNKQQARACAPAREIPNFKEMSDAELVDWAKDKPLAFDEDSIKIFEAYEKEMARRVRLRKTWNGKVVVEGRRFSRLKSYDQIFEENNVSIPLRNVMQRYMQFTCLNGRLLTNNQLETLLFELNDVYGNDDGPKIELVEKALKFGWKGIEVPGYRK